MAEHMNVQELAFSNKGRTIAIRKYSTRRDQNIGTKEVPALVRSTNSSGPPPTKEIPEIKVEFLHFWEVEDFSDFESAPATYIYSSGDAALAAHSYILTSAIDESFPLSECRDITPHLSTILLRCYNSIAHAEGPIHPQDPRPGCTSEPSKDKIATFAELRRASGDATPDEMKRLVVELFKEGNRNIRDISRKTGLSRNTIYLTLYALGLKGFKHSEIVSAIEQKVQSGRLRHGEPAPTAIDLANEYNILVKDATKVLSILRAADVFRHVPGRGMLVNNKLQSDSHQYFLSSGR
ncbi:GntR family transcriptional regulator [Acrocarpospora catenulata]|uniref:GntR family transcriptional regulator n=1 Tax=Acrocarpospora catenulata TaxID=2836182 RepID=UPI001BDB5EE6|nr:GntR family transcriptional regulator [Acrocarpospora catenulata]